MVLEAVGKKIVYERVDPRNAKQIEDASFCEREGFGTGLNPQELPPVLQFIAKHGHIWLQYVVEDGQQVPTGVMELIPLTKALGYRPEDINSGEDDLSISPFNVIMENQERAFASVRRFAKDRDIVYHHGIAMSRKGKGYGTLLLRYVLENTPYVRNHAVVCFPDAARIDEKIKELNLAPNEDSFTVHLKAGFVLAGVVDPPVYDETLTYYSFIRPAKKIKWAQMRKMRGGMRGARLSDLAANFAANIALDLNVSLTEGPAEEVLNNIRRYVEGYLGVDYSKETHKMHFVRYQT